MTLPRPVIAGNWKMHHGPAETTDFFRAFLSVHPARQDRTVAFFPPDVSLQAARDAVADRPDIRIGVQNIHWEPTGAFTGETSAPMAARAGATLVLVGHSERRHLFGETDAETARKVTAALQAGLIPVLCVGETLEERERGDAQRVVSRQLDAGLEGIGADEAGRLLIAYEPVWAIGTGRTASPADAGEMHQHVRGWLGARFGERAAAIPILYGGSVKPDNAADLLAAPEVEGLLVGGASLDPDGFASICAAGG